MGTMTFDDIVKIGTQSIISPHYFSSIFIHLICYLDVNLRHKHCCNLPCRRIHWCQMKILPKKLVQNFLTKFFTFEAKQKNDCNPIFSPIGEIINYSSSSYVKMSRIKNMFYKKYVL